MNRKQRRAEKLAHPRVLVPLHMNAFHWGEIKRLKAEYDAMDAEQQATMKPRLAAEIDEHLAALKAN